MNAIEIAAALLGIVNVALVVRRSIWNYPFGLAMVTLYGFVFFEARLYSDMLLQVFFFVVQLYGWINWSRADRIRGGVAIAVLGWPLRLGWLAFAIGFSAALGLAMQSWTDAAAPFADATIAGFSVTAQILLSLRRIENWVLWILIDIGAIALFLNRGLTVTAGLYAVFLLMSIAGLYGWLRLLRTGDRPA
ncbi:MAG: nicotinamide riboside transporter PnuC [Blastomonas sp.]